MKELFYCCECQNMRITKTIDKEQTLSVKGREITLIVPVRVCAVCGEEILDRELDSKTLSRFYDEYRKLERLLSPEEIKAIRQKYNLSQASFSKILGFGEKTITRYENGAIQDVCHDNMLRLMRSVDAFELLWKERRECLTSKEQVEVDLRLRTYNRTKILSTYDIAPSYYSPFSSAYLIKHQGELSYAV